MCFGELGEQRTQQFVSLVIRVLPFLRSLLLLSFVIPGNGAALP